MLLSNILSNLRTELQDTTQTLYTDDDLIRAIEKSVSLMSRLIPKRGLVETTIVRSIVGETLVIATNTGTLTYKPIKVGSVVITGKTLDTDYRINYLTGVVNEIGSKLPDGNYTVSYDLDPSMLDISSILMDYIKLERVEYPAGNNPPTLPTFDTFGSFLVFRGSIVLTENEHLRIIYLSKWAPPTPITEGDYPSHLDDVVIIGSSGQALIFKAEKYVQDSVIALVSGKTLLDGIAAVTISSAPDITAHITASQTALSAAIARFVAAVAVLVNMDTPLGAAVTALDKTATELAAGKAFLTTGAPFINAATRGDRVGEIYGGYGDVQTRIAQGYEGEGATRIALAVGWETKSARENTIGSSYINEAIQRLTIVSRLLERYRYQLEGSTLDISYYSRQLERVASYQNTANQYLNIAGRYLASGQAKINEFLISLGIKPEYQTSKASMEQRS